MTDTAAAHTPGPWTQDTTYWADIIGADGMSVAMMHSDDDVDGAPDAATAQANARLIAAAPDMLAAARDMLAWHGAAHDTRNISELLAGLRAAIAKAGG